MKCVQSYERRLVDLAVGRWRDNVNNRATLENGAETIIKRLRTRFLRQAFNLYLAGTKYHRKRQIEENRIVMYRKARGLRLLKKTFDSWSTYRDDFLRAKLYWNRIYCTIDHNMKLNAMKKWKT